MSNKKEVIEQIIGLLSSLIEDDPKPVEEVKQTPIRTKRRKTNKKNSNNKFDSMEIRHMHKDDVKIDKVLNSNPPCPRTRKYSTIDVACRSCGKKESVNPVLVTEPSRYKCNTCSTSGG